MGIGFRFEIGLGINRRKEGRKEGRKEKKEKGWVIGRKDG